MSDKIKVITPNGTECVIDVIDIIENEEYNKSYVAYNVDGSDDSFISVLNENENNYFLEEIKDFEEFKAVEDYLTNQNTK